VSINDLYRAITSQLIMRTKTSGVNKELILSLATADGIFRINPPDTTVVKIPSGKIVRFDNDSDVEVLEIADTGDVKVVNATKGLVLKDRVTASLYRLKVSSGVLSLEGA